MAHLWSLGTTWKPGGLDSQEGLVQQIKDLQKTNPGAKEQWIAYTDVEGGGYRDPARHSSEFLQAFLTHLGSGTQLSVGSAGSGDALTFAIKTLQKRSTNFKNAWANFCAANGGGRNDPSKHDAAFHVKFFEHVCSQASGGLALSPSMMLGGAEPPSKRLKGSVAAAFGDSHKEALVNQVKAYQRSGAEQKELWGAYADKNLGGLRDPSRHDASVLQEFVITHSVPETSTSPAGAASTFKGFDPEKDSFAERVKAFCKLNKDNYEIWSQFAGPTRDPGRHTAEKLKEFCVTFGC